MREVQVTVFSSIEEENEAEYRRLTVMSTEEREREMAALQRRVWGADWAKEPIRKIASAEDLSWWDGRCS